MSEAHVVALSGGKDSTALALRLAEKEPRKYIYAITPTGDELPGMIDHWKRVSELLETPLTVLGMGYSLQGLINKQNALPNNRMRWCTRMLKLEPYYKWIESLGPCISYVGLRADEETRKGFEFPEYNNITVRFPLREWGWGERDVWKYLDSKGVKIPARTDCARCYHQTLGEWWRLWYDHPEIYADAEQQEAAVSESRGKEHTFRNASRDTWPAGLGELRQMFEAGQIPRNTIVGDDLFVGGRRKTMCRTCSL